MTPTRIGNISPCFIVSDVSRAIEFYTQRLGFELRYSHEPDDLFFAIVGRDSTQIFVKAVAPGLAAQPNHTRHEWAGWDAFVYVDDPDSLAAEFADRGTAFHKEIVDRSDGLRGFEIEDADGYLLFFGCTKPISK